MRRILPIVLAGLALRMAVSCGLLRGEGCQKRAIAFTIVALSIVVLAGLNPFKGLQRCLLGGALVPGRIIKFQQGI